MKKISLFFITLVTIICLGVSYGSAKVKEDGKIYTGLGCTEIPNGVIIPSVLDLVDNDVQYNSLGWAFNSNTSETIVVACPIVREYTLNPLKRVHVSLLNETTEVATCEVETFNARGELIDESTVFEFAPNNVSGFPETIVKSNEGEGDSFLGLTRTNAGGLYVLACFLPAGFFDSSGDAILTKAAFIATYQVDEAVK